MKKIILGLIIVAFILVPVGKTEAKPLLENKPCGNTATYTLDEDGTLTVSGTGKVEIDEGDYQEVFKKVKKLVVGEGVKQLGYCGLSPAKYAQTVVLPESLTDLGEAGLYDLIKVKSIVLPSKVTELKEQVFEGCEHLESLTWPKNLKTIGKEVFKDCRSLKNLTIPDTVTFIGKKAFKGCTNLETITIPKNLKTYKADLTRMPKLMKVINKSKKTIKLDSCNGGKAWKVNGKIVKSVAPGKIATSKLAKYKINYYFSGGKPQGKCPKSYYYGKAPKLPDVKRKGYVFFGWFEMMDYGNIYEGFPSKNQENVNMTAVLVKVQAKRVAKDKVKITLKDSIGWKKQASDKWYLDHRYTYPKFRYERYRVLIKNKGLDGNDTKYSEKWSLNNSSFVCKVNPQTEQYFTVSFNWIMRLPYGDDSGEEEEYQTYVGEKKFSIPAYKK